MESLDHEHVAHCPACGEPIDYCHGHGEMGDPNGYRILTDHDDDWHRECHPMGCDSALETEYPAYAWPGGYPMEYITGECDVICHECAREAYRNGEHVTGDVYSEGPTQYCAACNREIESAYGDPEGVIA
jgi:hypothetical protein